MVIPLTLVLAWYLYDKLGGGGEMVSEVIELSSHTVSGEWFEGRPSNPQLEQLFFEQRDASNFEDSTYLAVVNFPVESKDSVKQFIGVFNPTAESGFQLPQGTYVAITMDMHSSVRPSPEKVREEAEKLASLEVWEVQVFTSESEIRVLFKVAD